MATTHRRKLGKFVTGVDVKSPQAALLMAMAAIDAGAFSKHLETDDDVSNSPKVQSQSALEPLPKAAEWRLGLARVLARIVSR